MKNWFQRRPILAALAVLILYVLIEGLSRVGIIPPYYQMTFVLICIYIILSVSQNLITGFTGQLAIGHAGFMAVGAYFSAIVAVKLQGPLWLALLVGALAGAVVGIVVGIPTLRLKGDYLAIATLGMAEIVRVFFLNWDYVGGASGFLVPQKINFAWAFWLMVLSVLLMRNFLSSSHGRACISIRENEIAAEVMGINITYYKVVAFCLGAFFAGLAGGIYANYMFLIQPQTFNFLKSFEILVMAVLGGLGSISGSIIGAIIYTIALAVLADFPEWRMVITAVLLIILMIFRPQGIMGTKELTAISLRNLNPLRKKGERNGVA